MRIGIVGSGIVGQTLGTALAGGGHVVALGTRDPGKLDEKKGQGASLNDWLSGAAGAQVVSFAQAARHGEVVLNATAGTVSLAALQAAGSDALHGKILIDVANPLDFSKGMPPTLTICNNDSLGERIQKAYPGAQVVKALSTLTAALMVNPAAVADGDHTLPICGNDREAKATVRTWLGEWFGWKPGSVLDIGDITGSRGMEMWLPLWVRLWQAQGTPMFNLKVVR